MHSARLVIVVPLLLLSLVGLLGKIPRRLLPLLDPLPLIGLLDGGLGLAVVAGLVVAAHRVLRLLLVGVNLLLQLLLLLLQLLLQLLHLVGLQVEVVDAKVKRFRHDNRYRYKFSRKLYEIIID